MKKNNDSTDAYLRHIISLYIKNISTNSKKEKTTDKLTGILKMKTSK